MPKKIQTKLILKLHEGHMSQNEIAASRHISKRSVNEVISLARERGITYASIKDASPEEVYLLFYPEKFQMEQLSEKPDYAHVHQELKRVGVTLKLLWTEYRESCQQQGKLSIGYTKFCGDYERYVKQNNLTNHLTHKPGDVCEVDWSGSHLVLTDEVTGHLHKVYLFVGVLPYSQYTYAEVCLDQKEPTWIRCHIHMLEFFGGVPRRIVCDNLKTGVIRHPREGEIVLNNAYEAFGNHYVTAILPAPVRKPKRKASVENAVGKLATAIIARLRNRTFCHLDELQEAVLEQLHAFNRAKFQKRPCSRLEAYQEEKEFLRPLPDVPYELATWLYGRKVYPNCHVSVEKNFYSVPYAYVGCSVDVKLMEHTLEIYCHSQRISLHKRFPKFLTGKYDTRREDMPDYFNQPEMNADRMCRWADKIGPNTREVVDRIFGSVQIQEQAYNSVLAVLKLSQAYTATALEAACQEALRTLHSPRYRVLKALLANQSTKPLPPAKKTKPKAKGFVRGSVYYGGEHHAE